MEDHVRRSELLAQASVLYNLGQLDKAVSLLDSHARLLATDGDAYSIRALIYFKQDQWDKAEITFKKGLVADPANFHCLKNLAELCWASGRFPEAKFFFIEALKRCKEGRYEEIIKRNLLSIERTLQHADFSSSPSFAAGPLQGRPFLDVLVDKLLGCERNLFPFNLDIETFDAVRYPVISYPGAATSKARGEVIALLEKLAELYDRLVDAQSRETLIMVLAYRILGSDKVKLTLNNPEYWARRKKVRELICSSETVTPRSFEWELNKFDLGPIGYDIRLFYTPFAVAATFVEKQYQYGRRVPELKPEKGDVVIDAGACFGDTALYFAEEVGWRGRVYSFECLESNIEIFRKNMELNPRLKKRIRLVDRPLWSITGQPLYVSDRGPAASISTTPLAGGSPVLSLAIDDFVNASRLVAVDYIKMDIEGAELAALAGAEQTIRKFKPDLAIAVYHQTSDFSDIFKFVQSLGLGYRFYMDHFTIGAQETVLFCTAE